MRTLIGLVLALIASVACTSNENGEAGAADVILTGTVTEIGGHGNAYTNLENAAFGRAAIGVGEKIRVVFNGTPVVLTVGMNYSDVPDGENVAVLHREGTVVFAIFNGDFHASYGVTPGAEFTITPVPVE